jgi:single-strand DNA-binding protein
MGSLNMVQLIGNLGRDAEMRYTPGGQAVATLNLATTEVWYDKENQKQEATEWHRIILWGKLAESLNQYLTKGKSIYVQGKLQTRKWTDKEGVERYTTEINGRFVQLLGGGGDGGGGGRGRGRSRSESRDRQVGDDPYGSPIDDGGETGGVAEPAAHLTDDDIPFAWFLPFVLTVIGAGLWM